MRPQSQDLDGLTAAGLLELAAQDFLPPIHLSMPDFAERYRYLPGTGGRGVPWRNDKTPYLVEIMEALDGTFNNITTAVVGPGQVAKTVAAENWLLKSVMSDPGNMLWYMQSDEALEAYVKDRINPLIDDHDEVSARKGPRPIDDSLHYKRFRGMSVQFLTASMGNLISKSAPRIVADEIDAYKKLLGDVKVLLDIRRQTYGDDSMLFALSHPDMARGMVPERDWNAGIMSMYADSTRCIWYWECPLCTAWSSPCPIAPYHMAVEYPEEGTLDEIQAGAFMACPHNGCVVPDAARVQMNRTGVWVGTGQEILKTGRINGKRIEHKTAGYWIVGPMSPFIIGGIGGLARARVKAERERDLTGEDEALRQVIVKQWGIPYSPARPIGSIDANDLADRAEPELKLGLVPAGVRFITIAVDCQLGFYEYLVRGWGVAGESWIIQRGRIIADPATNPDDWDKLLELFGTAWPLADESGRSMVARAAGFDSAGSPGVSYQAYSAWTRWRKAGLLRNYGQIGGREAWSIIGLKGASGLNAPKLQIVYPDTARKASTQAGRGEVPIGLFNPNLFKDDLAGQLMKAEAGPLYVHFPHELRSKEAPHVWFEQAVSERRLLNGRWEKLVLSARNEALDLLVMSHILAHLHGLPRINWEKPPVWAAPWDAKDANPLITAAPAIDAHGKTVTEKPRGGAVKVTIDQTGKKSIASRLA